MIQSLIKKSLTRYRSRLLHELHGQSQSPNHHNNFTTASFSAMH